MSRTAVAGRCGFFSPGGRRGFTNDDLRFTHQTRFAASRHGHSEGTARQTATTSIVIRKSERQTNLNAKHFMKTKKSKKTQITIANNNIPDVHGAETVMNELARVANERRQFIARLDDAILNLQADAAPGLKQLDTEIATRTEALRAWALASPEAFGKRKSIAFAAGTVGFRTGTPALEPLNRKWTWSSITAAVAQAWPCYIRTRTEVDRAALLARREDPELAAALPAVGLRVVQSEAFYVEAKLGEAKG